MRKRSRRQTRKPRRVLISPEFLVEYEPPQNRPLPSSDKSPADQQQPYVYKNNKHCERSQTTKHVAVTAQHKHPQISPVDDVTIIDDNYSSTDEATDYVTTDDSDSFVRTRKKGVIEDKDRNNQVNKMPKTNSESDPSGGEDQNSGKVGEMSDMGARSDSVSAEREAFRVTDPDTVAGKWGAVEDSTVPAELSSGEPADDVGGEQTVEDSNSLGSEEQVDDVPADLKTGGDVDADGAGGENSDAMGADAMGSSGGEQTVEDSNSLGSEEQVDDVPAELKTGKDEVGELDANGEADAMGNSGERADSVGGEQTVDSIDGEGDKGPTEQEQVDDMPNMDTNYESQASKEVSVPRKRKLKKKLYAALGTAGLAAVALAGAPGLTSERMDVKANGTAGGSRALSKIDPAATPGEVPAYVQPEQFSRVIPTDYVGNYNAIDVDWIENQEHLDFLQQPEKEMARPENTQATAVAGDVRLRGKNGVDQFYFTEVPAALASKVMLGPQTSQKMLPSPQTPESQLSSEQKQELLEFMVRDNPSDVGDALDGQPVWEIPSMARGSDRVQMYTVSTPNDVQVKNVPGSEVVGQVDGWSAPQSKIFHQHTHGVNGTRTTSEYDGGGTDHKGDQNGDFVLLSVPFAIKLWKLWRNRRRALESDSDSESHDEDSDDEKSDDDDSGDDVEELSDDDESDYEEEPLPYYTKQQVLKSIWEAASKLQPENIEGEIPVLVSGEIRHLRFLKGVKIRNLYDAVAVALVASSLKWNKVYKELDDTLETIILQYISLSPKNYVPEEFVRFFVEFNIALMEYEAHQIPSLDKAIAYALYDLVRIVHTTDNTPVEIPNLYPQENKAYIFITRNHVVLQSNGEPVFTMDEIVQAAQNKPLLTDGTIDKTVQVAQNRPLSTDGIEHYLETAATNKAKMEKRLKKYQQEVELWGTYEKEQRHPSEDMSANWDIEIQRLQSPRQQQSSGDETVGDVMPQQVGEGLVKAEEDIIARRLRTLHEQESRRVEAVGNVVSQQMGEGLAKAEEDIIARRLRTLREQESRGAEAVGNVVAQQMEDGDTGGEGKKSERAYPRSPQANELPGVSGRTYVNDQIEDSDSDDSDADMEDLQMPDKCREKPENDAPATQYVKFGEGLVQVFKPSSGSLYEAVAVSLTEHRRGGDWSPKMCTVIKTTYHDFLRNTRGGSDEEFVTFIAQERRTDGSDVFDEVEMGLDNNIYIHLYDREGPVQREKVSIEEYGTKTYPVHIYISETTETQQYMAIVDPPGQNTEVTRSGARVEHTREELGDIEQTRGERGNVTGSESALQGAIEFEGQENLSTDDLNGQSVAGNVTVTSLWSLLFNYKGESHDMGLVKFPSGYDGTTLYHAMEWCLTADTTDLESIRHRTGTSLHEYLTVLHLKYNVQAESVQFNHDFFRWLVSDFIEEAPPNHAIFGGLDKDHLIGMMPSSTLEGIVLHYALHKLVSIVIVVEKNDNLLVSDKVLALPANDDRAFIFLSYTNDSWVPLHSNGRFLWRKEDLPATTDSQIIPSQTEDDGHDSSSDTDQGERSENPTEALQADEQALQGAIEFEGQENLSTDDLNGQSVAGNVTVTSLWSLLFNYKGESHDMGLVKFPSGYDGTTLYHAMEWCLTADTTDLESIRHRTGMSLHEYLTVLHLKYNVQAESVQFNHDFFRWLVSDFIEEAPPNHAIFGGLDKDHLIGMMPSSTLEGIVLHYALHKLVSIVIVVEKNDNLLVSDKVLALPASDDRAFIFLLYTNDSWVPLHSNGRFLWRKEDLPATTDSQIIPSQTEDDGHDSSSDTDQGERSENPTEALQADEQAERQAEQLRQNRAWNYVVQEQTQERQQQEELQKIQTEIDEEKMWRSTYLRQQVAEQEKASQVDEQARQQAQQQAQQKSSQFEASSRAFQALKHNVHDQRIAALDTFREKLSDSKAPTPNIGEQQALDERLRQAQEELRPTRELEHQAMQKALLKEEKLSVSQLVQDKASKADEALLKQLLRDQAEPETKKDDLNIMVNIIELDQERAWQNNHLIENERREAIRRAEEEEEARQADEQAKRQEEQLRQNRALDNVLLQEEEQQRRYIQVLQQARETQERQQQEELLQKIETEIDEEKIWRSKFDDKPDVLAPREMKGGAASGTVSGENEYVITKEPRETRTDTQPHTGRNTLATEELIKALKEIPYQTKDETSDDSKSDDDSDSDDSDNTPVRMLHPLVQGSRDVAMTEATRADDQRHDVEMGDSGPAHTELGLSFNVASGGVVDDEADVDMAPQSEEEDVEMKLAPNTSLSAPLYRITPQRKRYTYVENRYLPPRKGIRTDDGPSDVRVMYDEDAIYKDYYSTDDEEGGGRRISRTVHMDVDDEPSSFY